MLIRRSVLEDVPSLARIYGYHVLHGTATFETVPPCVEEMERRREAVVSLGLPYLVAEDDERVLGYAYASPYRPRPAYRFTIENSIYVAYDAVGQGTGGQLLTALIEECEKGPWQQMVAVIGDSANAASIALHRRQGFEHVGVLRSVGWKFDRWLDTVLMQRALQPAESR